MPTAAAIGFIGAGNMGAAMIAAVLRSGLYPAGAIIASDRIAQRRRRLEETHAVATTADNAAVFARCSVVVLAVKPQQIEGVLEEIAPVNAPDGDPRKLVLSIAAGTRLAKIEQHLYRHLDKPSRANLPVVRVMPNTPGLVAAGMAGLSPNAFARKSDLETACRILHTMGEVAVFAEEDLDAVTALSGSGPAYVFYLIEAMVQAGQALGLEAAVARRLTLQTLKGALALLEAGDESPEVLRARVTSPGGTTEAALDVLEAADVKARLVEAITAAARRSQALSRI